MLFHCGWNSRCFPVTLMLHVFHLQQEAFSQLQGFVENALTPMTKQLTPQDDAQQSRDLHVLLAK